MSFFGYKRDRDPNQGLLKTSRAYRFVAGFGTVCFFAAICGWRPWSGSGKDWWTVLSAAIVGVGAVREGMGFINYALFWKLPEDINLWYAALLVLMIAGLVYFYALSRQVI